MTKTDFKLSRSYRSDEMPIKHTTLILLNIFGIMRKKNEKKKLLEINLLNGFNRYTNMNS